MQKNRKIIVIIIILLIVGLISGFGVRYYNGYWFFFDYPDRSGWVEEDGGKLYLDRHANRMTNVIMSIDSEKYYFDRNGWMYKGEILLGEDFYYFDETSGKMRYGWIERGDDRYYYDEEGHKVFATEYTIDGYDYLFDESGAEYIGTISMDGENYYYYEELTGKVKAREMQFGSVWRYFGDDGLRVETGWATLPDGRIAYYNGDEGMLFGEQNIDGKSYLLNISMGGRMTGTVYFNGEVYTIADDGVVQKKTRIPVWKGIDVSVHQEENVDWAAVAASGVQFAIVRGGYLAAEEDPIFALDRLYSYNVLEAQKNGISVGAYLYIYNYTWEGWKEGIDAFHEYNVENRIKLDLPVFLDIENEEYFRVGSDELGGYEYRTTLTRDGMEYLRVFGYTPGFYTFQAWADKVFGAERLYNEGYNFWLAKWYGNNSDLDPDTKSWNDDDHPSLWQFRATGQVPGIRKEVDMNYLYWDKMFQ